jgi:hypothetical protein
MVVERKHHHILEVVRALHTQASIPLSFWEECIITTILLINRLPSSPIQDKIPFVVLSSRDFDYS